MRNASLACATLGALLLTTSAASAACEAPSVSWSSFPSASECVGGVIGFVKAKWGLTFPATGGHATKDGCEALGACIEWVYDLPSKSEWNAHKWGSTKAQAYDIAVFPPISGDAYGHIAAIDHVSGSTLWLMDDNWDGLHERSCAWEGHSGWVHSTTWVPYGFFRLKKLEPWAAEVVSQTWPGAKDAADVITVGQTKTGSIKLKNIGTETWKPGVVKLAPIPHDKASPLAGGTWLSATRVSTVTADVKPGEETVLEWDLTGTTPGHVEPYFGLVAEKIAWFESSGGPSDATIRVNVDVVAPTETGDAGAEGDAGVERDGGPSVDGGALEDAGAGGASFVSGASGAGGASGVGGAGGAGGAGLPIGGTGAAPTSWGQDAGDGTSGEASQGGGCALSSTPSNEGAAGALLLLFALAGRRRRSSDRTS